MDAAGHVLHEAGSGAGGFVIDCELTAGARYYVRVAALNDSTGPYRLAVEQDTARAARPEAVSLSAEELSMNIGETQTLSAVVSPQDAHPTVTFTSSDSDVATVSQTGEVYAVGAGEAVITARAWGGASASCTVRVAGVPLSGIGFSQSALTLRVGESVGTALEFFPQSASDRRVFYSVEGAGIITVSPDGVVTGLAEGTARLVAVSADGGHTDILEVTVEPAAAKLRALIVGQQMYEEGVNSVRVGSINTAQSVSFLLQSQNVDGESYETTVLLDSGRAQTLAAIRTAFAEAKEGDISLFYITCHGYYAHGMSFFELYDGSVIAARDLERELRKVPGTVVVIADCCGSGGLIGRPLPWRTSIAASCRCSPGMWARPRSRAASTRSSPAPRLIRTATASALMKTSPKATWPPCWPGRCATGRDGASAAAVAPPCAPMRITTARSPSAKSAPISPAASPGTSTWPANWQGLRRRIRKTCRSTPRAIRWCYLAGRGNKRRHSTGSDISLAVLC